MCTFAFCLDCVNCVDLETNQLNFLGIRKYYCTCEIGYKISVSNID